tara:strand:+ start:1367 stop:2935 length:1569 start_codon:yes stop_codon:yes gene_type:complete
MEESIMNKITVFEAEKNDGLEEQIQTQASVAYVSAVCGPDLKPTVLQSELAYNLALKEVVAKAGKEDSDIYHTYSILVSTTWNKNDDVFNKEEVWAAKDTPKYKPTNLEHDEKKIVGGIIGNWPVDSEFNLIDENHDMNSLPDPFHILVASVIYRQWQDPEYQVRTEELIEKIEAGEMFVSMECVFRGFDYAVLSPNGESHVLARSAETAFLSKHLRAYGGSGAYQEHKVGRLLRNITFSGKGYVNKPANPESIIFDKTHVFDFSNASVAEDLFFEKSGVHTNRICSEKKTKEKSEMSNELLNDQIKELKESVASLKEENSNLSEKLSKADVAQYESEVAELNQRIADLSVQADTSAENLIETEAKVEVLTQKLSDETEAKVEAQVQIQEFEAEKVRVARLSALVEAGLDEDEALAKLEVFKDLNNTQFEAVADTIKAAQPTVEPTEEVEASEESADEDTEQAEEESEASEIDEDVLETASVEETVDLAVSSEEEGDDGVVRASLQDWVNSYVLNNESGDNH